VPETAVVVRKSVAETARPFLDRGVAKPKLYRNLACHPHDEFDGTGTGIEQYWTFDDAAVPDARDHTMNENGFLCVGGRIKFNCGTRVDVIYLLKCAQDKVALGIFESSIDYPGEGTPRKGGLYIAYGDCTKCPVRITWGENLRDLSSEEVLALSNRDWRWMEDTKMRQMKIAWKIWCVENVSKVPGTPPQRDAGGRDMSEMASDGRNNSKPAPVAKEPSKKLLKLCVGLRVGVRITVKGRGACKITSAKDLKRSCTVVVEFEGGDEEVRSV
jgi:hypothetical protein